MRTSHYLVFTGWFILSTLGLSSCKKRGEVQVQEKPFRKSPFQTPGADPAMDPPSPVDPVVGNPGPDQEPPPSPAPAPQKTARFSHQNGQCFQFTNFTNGEAMTAASCLKEGTPMETQQFYIEALNSGLVRLIQRRDKALQGQQPIKCAQAGIGLDPRIILQDCKTPPVDEQVWQFTSNTNNATVGQLKNKKTGKCVTLGLPTANGTRWDQGTCSQNTTLIRL